MTVRCPPCRSHPCKYTSFNKHVGELKPNQVYIDANWLYVNHETKWNVYNISDFVGDETLPFIDINGNILYIRPHDLDMCNRCVKGHYHP